MTGDAPPFAPTTEAISPATTAPSKSEMVSVIKSLSSDKTAGNDAIPPEFYKSNPYMTAKVIQPILEDAWLSEEFPEEWTDGIIVKIPINLKISDNGRGICVLFAISKIISKVILDRIKEHLYSIIDREQVGFRPGSSCVGHQHTSTHCV